VTVASSRYEARMLVEPLPDDVVLRLRSDPTAALAAALIVAGAFPDIVSWAARTICGSSNLARQGDSGANGGGGSGTDRSNGEGGAGTDRSNDTSGERGKSSRGPTQVQERLLALMRANPGATVVRLAELSRRSQPAIAMCLKRLKEAGLVNHGGHGSWTPADIDPVDAAPPSTMASWVSPLSGRHVARFTACGRVREQMATAGSA
jgi:hypothetical protein